MLFLVTQVGTEGPGKPVEALNVFYAVAAVAGCEFRVVGLPIWGDRQPTKWQSYARACFMPCDDTSRQWIVTRADGLPLATDYRVAP